MKILCVIFVVVLAGCVGVKPPERPVAYLVPSLVPYSVMARCVPHKTSSQEVRGLLEQAGVLDSLLKAGMRDMELGIVARGLTSKGYAEIDCRKTAARVRWISLGYDGKNYILRAGIAEAPKGPVVENVYRM